MKLSTSSSFAVTVLVATGCASAVSVSTPVVTPSELSQVRPGESWVELKERVAPAARTELAGALAPEHRVHLACDVGVSGRRTEHCSGRR